MFPFSKVVASGRQRTLLLQATILFFAVAFGNVTRSNAPYCQPVAPSMDKERTLDKFRKENYAVPLMFWHLQKAGGTTLCLTFLQSYEQMLNRSDIKGLYPGWENCNEPQMTAEILLHPNNTYIEKYRPKGKYLMAIEPSHSFRRKKTGIIMGSVDYLNRNPA